jgi:hypothetical protein
MSEISITLIVVAIAVAVLIVIVISIFISCKNAETMEGKPMPEKRLLLKLSDQETRDYCAARDRLSVSEKNVETGRAEIFGWHYEIAVRLKKNPTEIHIERDGTVWTN